MKLLVNISNARTPHYRKILQEIQRQGKCPFCPANFKYHNKPILKKEKNWFITDNFNPYPGANYHFIIIGPHREKMKNLSNNDFLAIRKLIVWAEKKFKLKGGGFAMRFGDIRYTGATVTHIHGHLIVPKINKKTGKAAIVSFPIG